MIGDTLAHYRIEARLGTGGMGTVYRARDERLHRTVAIKVVSAERLRSASDDEALLREARAASALNHPHVCTVHEVGEAEGRPFIVMEYVDGKPLSQMIPNRGLPYDSVIRYGLQIADALVHAHEHGVLHRDLKTANVVVTRDGRAKVLDFGLARRAIPEEANSETRSRAGAGSGTVAGTLAYMAPELLAGEKDDERSDIWALGVVLYEMAAGELPFSGRNDFALTAAILREPPQPLEPHVPAILRGIILRCMAKEPERRYQQAREVRAALEATQSDEAVVPLPATSDRRIRVLAAAGALVLLAALIAWALTRDRRSAWEELATEGRLRSIVSSDERTFYPTLSPDGRMLAYVAEQADGRVDLYTRRVAGGVSLPLTEDAAREYSPMFSPDGERIAFARRGADDPVSEIRIVSALGGAPVTVIRGGSHPAWAPDGDRLAYIRQREDGTSTDLAVANADGSSPRVVMRADGAYPFLREPAWSPDGRELVVVRSSGGVAAEMWRVSADGGPPIPLRREPAAIFSESPRYTHDGRGIVHSSNRAGATNIWFQPLDGGEPIRLTSGPGPDEAPSVARNGAIAFVNSRWRYVLERHDLQTGEARVLASHPQYLWGPDVSPDGEVVAFSRSESDGAWHLWSVPTAGGEPRRLTNGESGELYPKFAADGRSLLFYTWSRPRRVGRVPRDGGPPAFLSLDGDGLLPDPSPDGASIAFARSEGDVERIYVLGTESGWSRRLSTSPGTAPRWSPDGRRLAFSRDRSWNGGISIIGADGSDERQVRATGGWPVWWPDGRELGYLVVGPDGNQQIEVMRLAEGSVRLLEDIRLIGTNHPFAVHPDGGSLVVSNSQHLTDEIWLLERPE